MAIDSKDTFTDYVPTEVVLDTTFKNQMVNAPSPSGKTVAGFAVVFAPLDANGDFIVGKDALYRFDDDPICTDPVLKNLATRLILMQLTSLVSLKHDMVKELADYVKANYDIEITQGMTASDGAKMLKQVGAQLIAAQKAARPEPEPTSPAFPHLQ